MLAGLGRNMLSPYQGFSPVGDGLPLCLLFLNSKFGDCGARSCRMTRWSWRGS
jgi:hypothetical protein